MKTQFGLRMFDPTPIQRSKAARKIGGTARSATASFALVCATLFSPWAMADSTSEVSALMKAGQFTEALAKTDAVLIQTPRDKQMRFLKGVLLTELNRPNEAIIVFTKLTEDFPELPEPYNNLAVLFAANGQYDKARTALEMAIRTNPTYATAHENLGDVYAKLASQAYDKALQLDSGNTTAKSKLTMIRTLVGASNPAATDSRATVAVAKSGTTPAPVKSAAAPAVIKPLPKVEVAKVDIKPEPKAEAKVENKVESKAEDRSAAKVVVADATQSEVMSAVNGWAKAWSAKDVATYLSYYTGDFQPQSGQSHKTWADDRRARIESKGSISVDIGSPQVRVDGTTATVRFRQRYVSNQLRSNGPKTLVLSKQSGKWQIKQERAGS